MQTIIGGRCRKYPVRVTRHNRLMYLSDVMAYVDHLRAAGMSRGTVTLKRQHLERCFSFLGKEPRAIGTEDLVHYLAVHEWAPETRKSIRSSLRGFYAWMEESGRVADDPSRRLPRVPVPAGVPHPTPTPVVEDALAQAEPRVLLMIELAAFAGLRRAEIATLHTDCIVGDDLVIRGKGGKERVIPLHPRLADDLGRLPRGWVFPGHDNGHLSPDRVGRLMAAALEGKWTAHSLRHRFATRAYAGERDLLTVQQLLGHASVATTQRYTQVPDDALRRAVHSVA